ncbi:hypothetical protein KIN20_030905 [Parelaphostrongylus tenuis]|uniref:Uncharacterized protein n=1 Tax=Parelaphostrongylus tenuis TaxID=148309 RepID=A0AAD5R4E5_PARTN|nr:hypothetical protein KIN20_030905 [Parelaphostrongylus tenuis]
MSLKTQKIADTSKAASIFSNFFRQPIEKNFRGEILVPGSGSADGRSISIDSVMKSPLSPPKQFVNPARPTRPIRGTSI